MTEVARLRTREVVGRDRFPNFRDHRKMVDGPLLRVVASLQKKYGRAFASEAGLRRMICEDTGHMPGVDTVPTALERLEREGIVWQRWLRPGGTLPDGRPCTYGTRVVFLPQCRHDRRGLRAVRNRRETISGRVDKQALATLEAARRAIGKTLAPGGGPPPIDLEARRQDAIARLRELEAMWGAESKPEKPPD